MNLTCFAYWTLRKNETYRIFCEDKTFFDATFEEVELHTVETASFFFQYKEEKICLTNDRRGEEVPPFIKDSGLRITEKPILVSEIDKPRPFLNRSDFVDDVLNSRTKSAYFSVDGTKITPVLEVGEGVLSLPELRPRGKGKRRLNCIDVEVSDENIKLENYYFYKSIDDDCEKIPHEDFFKLLDAIASVLELDVHLHDASTKKVKDSYSEFCVVPHYLLALVKGRTFYNHFEFKNEEYDAVIQRARKQKLMDFNPELEPLYKRISGESHATLKEVAQFLMDKCHRDDAAFSSFRQAFMKNLKDQLPSSMLFVKKFTPRNYNVRVHRIDGVFHVDFVNEDALLGGKKKGRTRRKGRFAI